jgi:hypothetical protein
MDARQRYAATAAFGTPDRAFLLPPWAWESTRVRWEAEGFPAGAGLEERFGTDREESFPLRMQGPYGPHLVPPLERTVVEETAEHVVVRDEEGNTLRLFRDDPLRSMPEWRAYPMAGRADWEGLIRPRLDAAAPGRVPSGPDLDAACRDLAAADAAVGVWCGSFYGWPRSFMGVERMSLTIHDDPFLVREMCEHIAAFTIACLEPLVARFRFDLAYIWEDMAGKAGPLCSPATYRELMLPSLSLVTAFLHGHGIHTIIVDSDGNNDVLVPLWLEAGVTGLRPFEIAAGCDPVTARRRYGRDLVIQGGIDKRALAQGPGAIDHEVLSKVPWLCLQGGYFPQVDHLVPPDVSLENYAYYAALVRAVAADPERSLAEARHRGFWPG